VEDDTTPICELLYFYTTWCPYCKKSLLEWNKFKLKWNNTTMHGYTIVFKEIECESNDSMAKKYDVTTYPTIKMVKDGLVTSFDAKPTVDVLTRFLMTSFD